MDTGIKQMFLFHKSQRGAMFGLDARVALAIFGGLSAIAGTAVFSAVRDTRVTGVLTEFDNISKGYINHVFDTGVDITQDATVTPGSDGGTGTAGFKNLYRDANGTLNWNGPYVTIATNLHAAGYGQFALRDGRIDGNWGTPPGTNPAGSIGGKWLTLSAVPCEIAGDLKRKIDGQNPDGTPALPIDAGNFRYTTCTAGNTVLVSYLISRLR
jgi:hypothetical protein